MLMPGYHNIDIFRINYLHSHRIKADLRLSHEDIIYHIDQNQSVNTGRNPQP